MELTQKEVCWQIANYYGKNHQLFIAVEELSELTKEICKFKRMRNNKNQMIDEIADVKIMVEQLEYLFDVSEEVSERITYKLDRQLKRIEEERE